MKAALRRLTAQLFEFQTRRLMARRQFKVVGVSGAVGKTTTKLLIATVLRQKYRVVVQQGSFNDEIGLPLACFDLPLPRNIFNPLPWLWLLVRTEWQLHRPYPYDVLVIEIGTDAPGEVPHTLTYLKPDIGVVTAVVPEHMEHFGTLDVVAQEELALAGGSHQALVNYDDVAAKYRHKYVDGLAGHMYYGLSKEADYRLAIDRSDVMTGTQGTLMRPAGKNPLVAHLKLYSPHSAKGAAAAFAVGDLMGLSDKQLEAGLAALVPVKGRMQILAGLNGATIIDDTYNSSPEAALAALRTLADTTVTGRRIAIMGSMNELGDDSDRYHQEVGAACADLDLLVTFGAQANQHLGPMAVAKGLDERHWKPADSPYAAGEYLKLIIGPGDVVLAKGSEGGIFTEEAVKILLADPADAARLVRQSPTWMERKRRRFPDAS